MQDRGTHSSGVAGICEEHTWCSVKQAVPAAKFVQTEDWKEFVKHSPQTVIGHTRYATIGAISDRNAHPFHFGNIVGAHNGHVSNWQEVYNGGEVDSEAIFWLLNEEKNNYKKAFKALRGKFALTWFTPQDNKLHFALDGNPLTIVKVKELDTYFWLSTFYPLQAIIGSHFDLEGKTFWSPKEKYVYEMRPDHNIKKKQVEFGEYIAPSYYNRPTTYNTEDDYDWRGTALPAIIGEKIDDKLKETYNYEKVMDLTVSQMRTISEMANEGCQMCDTMPDMENEEYYWHETDKILLCYKCASQFGDMDNYTTIGSEDLMDIDAELWELDDREGRDIHGEHVTN